MDLKYLILEPSKVCNLRCPECIPHKNKGIHLDKYILMDIIKRNPSLKTIEMCGTQGDAIMHPNIKEIIEYGKKYNINFIIETNGNPRGESWWEHFGTILGKSDKIIFALDGINQEKYSKYRIGGDIERVLGNHAAFRRTNQESKTAWKMIEFSYNLQDYNKAEELAQKHGFSEVIRSMTWKDEAKIDEMLKDSNFKCKVKCESADEEYVYIDAYGYIFPCMFSRRDILTEHGLDHIDVYKKEDLEKINYLKYKIGTNLTTFLETNYKKYITGRTKICERTCGTTYKKVREGIKEKYVKTNLSV